MDGRRSTSRDVARERRRTVHSPAPLPRPQAERWLASTTARFSIRIARPGRCRACGLCKRHVHVQRLCKAYDRSFVLNGVGVGVEEGAFYMVFRLRWGRRARVFPLKRPTSVGAAKYHCDGCSPITISAYRSKKGRDPFLSGFDD